MGLIRSSEGLSLEEAGGYGEAQLGLFGGGGGISSESGSDGRFRLCALTPWAQRSRYSKRISFVTGSWMLLHTAGQRKTNGHSRKEVITETLTGCFHPCIVQLLNF